MYVCRFIELLHDVMNGESVKRGKVLTIEYNLDFFYTDAKIKTKHSLDFDNFNTFFDFIASQQTNHSSEHEFANTNKSM